MNLIDSSVWLEYFAAGPQAGPFAAVIEDVDELLVPTIVLVEVTGRVLQQRDENAALQIAAMLHREKVVTLDAGIALSAAQLAVTHKLDRLDHERALRRGVQPVYPQPPVGLPNFALLENARVRHQAADLGVSRARR